MRVLEQERFSSVKMGRIFVVELDGKLYRCHICGTHLALADDLISKVYRFTLSIDITSFLAFLAVIPEVCVFQFDFNLIVQLIVIVLHVILMFFVSFVVVIVKNCLVDLR